MRGKTMKKAEKVSEEKSKGSFKDRRKRMFKRNKKYTNSFY